MTIDYEIISKVFSARLKKVLPLLLSSRQSAYVAKKCLSESGRLISDLLHVTENFETKDYLAKIDTGKAFDYLGYSFLLATLEKFDFGTTLTDSLKILLKDQESYVINGAAATQYFKLEKGAQQGGTVPAYMFILYLEILFTIVNKNKDII